MGPGKPPFAAPRATSYRPAPRPGWWRCSAAPSSRPCGWTRTCRTLLHLGRMHGWDVGLAARRGINEAVLRPRRRELNGHGIQRTFRFWSDIERADAVARLDEPRAVLVAAGYDVFLGYGALLGFVRDGALIPHDDDLDLIALPGEGQPEGLAPVHAILAAAGFETET